MARPLRIEYPGAFYHITARGNERKDIFWDERDKERFLAYLETAVVRYKAVIHVYCLMNNHYHLLMSTPAGNLSQIIRHINGAYTIFFNKRHHRFGHLFQGRYKAILVDADVYAAELSRYIHLNPVRAGLVKLPGEYPWTNYLCYIGEKKAPKWQTMDWLLGYFGRAREEAKREYRAFVESKIVAPEDPLKKSIACAILGRPHFIEEIKRKYLGDRKRNRDVPAVAVLTRQAPQKIAEKVRLEFRDKPEYARKIAIYLSHRFSGIPLKEIGRQFSIGESAVSQASRRFESTLSENPRLREKVNKVRKTLNLCTV
jgi:REP element-mobilizing transposase RayT